MGNIKMSTEQIKDLHYQFLTDRRIATLNNEIAAIYNIAIPKVLIKEGEISRILYDEKVEYEVNRIRTIISTIIKNDYSELLENEL